VVGLDAPARRVLVGPRPMLAVDGAVITETNRIGPLPTGPLTAKVRSMAKPVPVTLEGAFGDGASATIRFTQPEYGVAPGQAAVIYAGERVVGGGWIDSTQRSETYSQGSSTQPQPSL
jgi:tRNA-uridine 2-sulfurtransferase